MRRRGSMLEMRGGQSSQGSQGASLSGSDNSINSVPSRRSTVTRRSFGDPPPLPGKKAVIVNSSSRPGPAVTSTATNTPNRAVTPASSTPSTPPAVGAPSAPFSSGRTTIVHRPTKEARKAEIVAAVTKRLYTQKKKPEPGSPGWPGPWPGVGGSRSDYAGAGGTPSGGTLPDTSEEAEDEPKELKLCSNARLKLQEISKRALALHLHRKRRDQEAQTEGPGVLRVREKACGTDTRTEDKECQHPHPFYLQPLWAAGTAGLGPWDPGLWGQRHGVDEAFSDDSLEPTPPEPDVLEPKAPPCGTLLRAYTLRSGGRFRMPTSQTYTPTYHSKATVEVGTTMIEQRDAGTMTFDSNDKSTMTSQVNDVAVMTVPEEPPFKDAGTTTVQDAVLLGRDRDAETEEQDRTRGLQQALRCDVRLSYQPTYPHPYRAALPPPSPNVLSSGQHIPSGATDDRPPLNGKQNSRASHQASHSGPARTAPPPTEHTAAPPDIIAEAGTAVSTRVDEPLAAVVTVPLHQQHVFSLEIIRPLRMQPLSLDAQLSPLTAQTGAPRSRSLDNIPPEAPDKVPEVVHPRPLPAAVPIPPTCDAAPTAPTSSAKKFRLPYLSDTVSGSSPRPSATARPVREPSLDAETPTPLLTPKPPPRSEVTLTAKQRRLLVNLLHVRPERLQRRRAARPAPSPRCQRATVPDVPDPSKQAVLQSLSCLLAEAAVYVRTAKDGLGKVPLPVLPPTPKTPPPVPPPTPLPAPPAPPAPRPQPLMTSCTQTDTDRSSMCSKSTQSISNVGSQCSLLAPRAASTLSRGSQCALPPRATSTSATQWTRPWEDGDLTWGEDREDRDVPQRKAESMSDLSWRTTAFRASRTAWSLTRAPDAWLRYPRRPALTCIHPNHHHHHQPDVYHRGLHHLPGPPTISPKQYLYHLVSLRRGVVLASREAGPAGRGWCRAREDGRDIFPS